MTTPNPAINPAISAEELEREYRELRLHCHPIRRPILRRWYGALIALRTHGAPSEEGRDD